RSSLRRLLGLNGLLRLNEKHRGLFLFVFDWCADDIFSLLDVVRYAGAARELLAKYTVIHRLVDFDITKLNAIEHFAEDIQSRDGLRDPKTVLHFLMLDIDAAPRLRRISVCHLRLDPTFFRIESE